VSRLGWVTQLSPLRVQLLGDTTDALAEVVSDFTGATATASPATATLVLVETVEARRFATRILLPGAAVDLSAWTAYTPALGGAGWGLGNGTLACAYQRIGKGVLYRISLTLGSTSTAGTGGLTLALPLTALLGTDQPRTEGQFLKASNSARYPLQGLGTSTTVDSVFVATSPMGALTSTVPVAPLTGDKVLLAGLYEAA
jgi:hypothetical protein